MESESESESESEHEEFLNFSFVLFCFGFHAFKIYENNSTHLK